MVGYEIIEMVCELGIFGVLLFILKNVFVGYGWDLIWDVLFELFFGEIFGIVGVLGNG